jgi:hypothetical protein
MALVPGRVVDLDDNILQGIVGVQTIKQRNRIKNHSKGAPVRQQIDLTAKGMSCRNPNLKLDLIKQGPTGWQIIGPMETDTVKSLLRHPARLIAQRRYRGDVTIKQLVRHAKPMGHGFAAMVPKISAINTGRSQHAAFTASTTR